MAIMVNTYKPTATTTNSNYNRILVYRFLVFYLDYYFSFVYWLTVCKPECFVFDTNKALSIYLSIVPVLLWTHNIERCPAVTLCWTRRWKARVNYWEEQYADI